MHAVGDQLHDDVLPGESGAGHPGIPVSERAHRVEEVGHRARAVIERAVRHRRRRVGVAERDDDPAPRQRLDQVDRLVELGREGDHA